MAKKKVSRKELLKSQDEFITFFQRIVEFSLRYQKQLITTGVVILVLLVGTVGFKFYTDLQAKRALNAYAEVISQIRSMEIGSDEDLQNVAAAFEKFREKYPRSPSARQALIQLGSIYFQLKRYEEAKKTYQSLLDTLRHKEENLRPFLLDSLAYVYEAEGNSKDAAAKWEELVRLPGSSLKEQAYLNLGRIYEADHKPNKAREAYQRLIDNFPDSDKLKLAKARLEKLI